MIQASIFELTQPLIDYCLKASPESRDALEVGYTRYQSVMMEAQDSWLRALPGEQLKATITLADEREASQKMAEASAQLLVSVRQHDATLYCTRLAERLRNITPEAARESIRKGEAMLEGARRRMTR